MGMAVGGNKGGMDQPNVTPLIDVVLVLLIIFMVLTPITVQKMANHMPPKDDTEEPPPPPDQPPDQLMVAVYEDGSVALNLQKKDTDDALHKELELRLKSKEKKTVFVDAHPSANYNRVVQVIDLVRDAGATKVGFPELKEEGPSKPLAPGEAPILAGSVPAPPAPPAPPPK